MNLGTWRIVIIVALVVVGVAVLANGFDEASTAVTAPSGSASPTPDGDGTDSPGGSPSPTEAPPEPTPEPNTSGVLIKVINGTDAPGYGGELQDALVAEGYKAPEIAGDAPAKPVADTVVYYRGGPDADQNEADATYLARTHIKPVLQTRVQVEELSSVYDDMVGESVTVVVLIGEDYVAAVGAEG